MTFERHLFISYAHLDNRPITREQDGWVSRFHDSLEAALGMQIGHKVEVWRDKKLSGNDFFSDEIVAQFPKTAMLVSVLTPGYVESDWCMKEVREFCKVAGQCGGVRFHNKSRLIKVIKTPVRNESSIPLLREMLGYDFYTEVDGVLVDLDPSYSQEIASKYCFKVVKMARDLAETLTDMEASNPGRTAAPVCRASIYLAQCSSDRRDAREALEADLRAHGYRVLPDESLPTEEAACVAEVKRLLEECVLSIHLVGSGYGFVPDGSRRQSVVVLQNELAIERSRSAGMPRLIWLQEGTESQRPEQQQFMEALHEDAETQFGADLITADLETLKGAIHSALRRIETPEQKEPEPGSAGNDRKLVYLVFDEEDRTATYPLRKYLKGQGFEVQVPIFEGTAEAVRKENENSLRQCHAVILFYGAGDEAWKRAVEGDFRKMGGLRRKPVYTYLADPVTAGKKDLIELEEPNVIRCLDGFSEAEMKPFIAALRTS
jgi:TIR domain